MKKIILLVITALMMAGCDDIKIKKVYEQDGFATLNFDSCEYVFKVSGYKGFLAHKGNCKFCEKRRQKEMKELLNKLKEK